ncbi:MAG: topoisomerase [Patescibacteria group bacterium]|nr:type I DNA topoisomerase [Candidatus Saccharibacteria bacterium]MDQ5963822.1 topoisomerase [Patescibacteria group bacterium]
MSKNLVIVESPAKAKTIEKYLGKDFKVLSSIGHIRSIAKKNKDGSPPIDVGNNFKTTYEIDPEKKKVITELKKAVKAVDTVWLATDEDREGEAIAWHLCEVLKLDPKTTKRIVFHEITKSAIEEAVKNPRTVDMRLVQAQQARQILDRIVGFELSPVVWQKVPGGKSAGRVQSPAVRLLVEREREIRAFEGTSDFKVVALFSHDGEEFKAELTERFSTERDANSFLETLHGARCTVVGVKTSPGTRNPSAPFTTSTLQQEANARLGFGSKATMTSAQRLYQAGKITYMRTDSVNLSKQAVAATAEYIQKKHGKEYVQVRTFKTKNANAQEAHEAIRPTDAALEVASSDPYDQKLYDLIRRRTVSSQMAPARLEKTVITIKVGDTSHIFEAKGEVIVFDGFLRVYGRSRDDSVLPAVESGQEVPLVEATARETFSKPPARFTEGSLVKKLEELGIGRPSTYATIIGTVQARGYALRGEGEGNERDVTLLSLKGGTISREIVQEKTGSDKGKLVPTSSGELIADFLTNHFDQIVDYGFTASVEEHFDDIASDKLERNAMLKSFYDPFHALIDKSGSIDRSSVAQTREIGLHPKTNKMVSARFGRFGPMLQLGAGEDEEKPQFAPLPKGARLETITLEEALRAFELPRLVGQTEDGQDILANIGRFGPYIKVGSLFISIKPHDPHDIDLTTAREFYTAKLQAEAEKNIADFGDGIKVLKGRWGPYVTDGSKNAKVSKDIDPTSITREQALKMLSEAPAAKKRPAFRRKKAT